MEKTLTVEEKEVLITEISSYFYKKVDKGWSFGHICQKIWYKECWKDHLNFPLCTEVDRQLFGPEFGGSFWTSAYGYPREGEKVDNECKAVKVGLFTFCMEPL